MNKPNTNSSIEVLFAIKFFLVILSLMIYAFIGITHSKANATSNVLVTPTSSSATYVAPIPKNDGIYKICDKSNLIYELFSTKKNEYGAVASAMQVQFNSSKCQNSSNLTLKYVAPLPQKDGVYKICDENNLVYELFSTKKNEYGAVTSSLQVQFESSQCPNSPVATGLTPNP